MPIASLESITNQYTDLVKDLNTPIPGLEGLAQNRAYLPMFNKLSAMYDNVSNLVKTKLTNLTSTPKLQTRVNKITTALRGITYLDLRGLPIPVVPGQTVGFKQFFTVLLKSQSIVNKLYDYTLHPFKVFLAETINEPQRLESNFHSLRVQQQDLPWIKNLLGSIVGRGGENMPYEKVVTSNQEWQEVYSLMDDLVSQQKQTPIELITGEIQQINELMTKVISNIENTNEQFRLSPNMIRQLADLCHSLAEHATYYSTHVTLCNMASIALGRAEAVISEAVKP
jgi:hypothetical protein